MSYSPRFEIFDLLEKRCSDIGALMRALDGVEEKIYVEAGGVVVFRGTGREAREFFGGVVFGWGAVRKLFTCFRHGESKVVEKLGLLARLNRTFPEQDVPYAQ
jgi:hypothetical protein